MKPDNSNVMGNAVKITIIRDHATVETTGKRILIIYSIYRSRTSVAINLVFKLNLRCMWSEKWIGPSFAIYQMPSVLFKITNPQRCKLSLRDKVNHFSIIPLERKFALNYIQNFLQGNISSFMNPVWICFPVCICIFAHAFIFIWPIPLTIKLGDCFNPPVVYCMTILPWANKIQIPSAETLTDSPLGQMCSACCKKSMIIILQY